MPSVAPLPMVAQANPNAGGQPGPPGQVQPGTQRPPASRSPTTRQPAAPPARTGPTRTPQAGSRPADDVNQQVQFDQGGLVTMHTNELDIRQLLELLSRRSGMNILVSPKVSGNITANFEGVTVEKVLEAIIKLADLTDKREGSIHYIYTKEELQDEEEFTKKERILTKVYKLNYVRADEILGVIRPFLSHDVGQRRISVTPSYKFGISESATFVSGGGQQMSAGGSGGGVSAAGGSGGPGGSAPTGGGPTIGGFQPPTGGNSLADYDHLIIQDYESNLKIIDQIIQRIDVRPVQVLIEAVIISVDYEHDRELGVNLGLVDNLGQALGTIGSGTALNGNVGFTPTQLLTTGGKIAQGPVTDAQGFTSATNGVKFGFVSNNVTGFIRALETIGNTKILASPRILVLNKQRAEIQLGTRLGFQTLSQNFTSTIQQVQFLNTGTLLRLRPFVSDDGMVRMEIHPERSSGTVTNNIPNQNTAELTTNVMVPDSSTLVIGGLIEDEDDYNYQGLPILSRFPALGFLTGVNQKTEGRRELVVLLTPHIWSGEMAMAHASPAQPNRGAFGAGGPVANTAMTFDLETGRPSANAPTAPGTPPPAGPGGNPGGPRGPQGPSDPNTTGAAAGNAPPSSGLIASAAAPAAALAPGVGSANAPQNDPSTSKRHRWAPIRDWFARRSRERQSPETANPVGSPQPQVDPPAVANDPRAAMTAAPLPAGDVGPGPVATPVAPAGSAMPPPTSSEQQPLPPEKTDTDANLQPMLPVPVGDAGDARHPMRDPMLAQVALERVSPDAAGGNAGLPGRPPEALKSGDGRREGQRRGVVAGPRRHTTGPGESFATIARMYYGSERFAEPLLEYNRGRTARGGLKPGDLLVIPRPEELPAVGGWVVPDHSRRSNEPVSADTRFTAVREGDLRRAPRASGTGYASRSDRRDAAIIDAPPTSRPRAIYHVVGPAETPRSIARDRLGDPRRAAEIVDLNHNLLTNEGRWKAGLRILLPPDAAPPRESP